jgi:DUF1680 family protein
LTRAGAIALKMVTQFPYDNKVQLTVNTTEPVVSKIRIRIPSWASKKMAILINGKETVNGSPGTYVTLNRRWKDGDVISFTLPMDFRMTKYVGEEKAYQGHYALEYGPVLMAFVKIGENKNSSMQVSPEKLIRSLKTVPGKPLHYFIAGTKNFEVMPYFEVQDEPFTCYP